MSEEIKDNEDVHSDKPNQDDGEDDNQKISLNDPDEENEPSLATPNGHETPSLASFSDVIVEKQDESPVIVEESRHQDLLQVIADKSNKDASSTILNTVEKAIFVLFMLTLISFF